MKNKEVEYKDTNRFAFSPKYEYPLKIRGRWLQFHALSKNYIKILNYAVKFRQPEGLLAVYLYGDIDVGRLNKYLSKIGGENIYVFVWKGIDKIIEIFEKYENLIKKLHSLGYAPNGEISQVYFEEREKFYKAEKIEGITTPQTKEFHDDEAIISEYLSAVAETLRRKEAEVYGNGAPITVQQHYDWLFDAAKKEYPYGIEADTDNENAYKTLSIGRLLDSIEQNDTRLRESYGISISEDKKVVQLSLFDRISNASIMIAAARNFAKREIENRGRVFHEAIIFELRKKPYGWFSQNNYYAYVLGLAIRRLCDIPNIACHDTINTYDYSVDQALWFVKTAAKDDFRRRYQLQLFINSDSAKRLSKVIYRLFELPKRKEMYSGEKYLKSALVRISIEVNTRFTRYPYADIDNKIWELLNELDPIYDTRYDEFAEYFEKNMNVLKQKMKTNDEIQRKKWIDRYGEKEGGFIDEYLARPKCYYQQFMKQGEFEEMAKEYHDSIHCRECGRSIDNLSQAYEKDPTQLSGYEYYDFNLQEVIGLNKKLLGRVQIEIFCLDCLMEFLEIKSARDLRERIDGWKSQGCTLFQ